MLFDQTIKFITFICRVTLFLYLYINNGCNIKTMKTKVKVSIILIVIFCLFISYILAFAATIIFVGITNI